MKKTSTRTVLSKETRTRKIAPQFSLQSISPYFNTSTGGWFESPKSFPTHFISSWWTKRWL